MNTKPKYMIKREIYNQLKAHLYEKEITLIAGPRQCGKTTIINLLIQDLIDIREKFVYLNLDIEKDFAVLESQEIFIQYLKLNLGTVKSFVFIDEIQRKENAGIFLKGIYDSNLPYKFIISGSGSVELKEKVSEGLAGRKKTFSMNTISFKEFINFRTEYKYENALEEYLRSPFLSEVLLTEYMQFGGYPNLVTNETADKKREVLNSIFDSYVTKDLKELVNLQRPDVIADLMALLSTRIGKITSISEISNRININYATIKEYLYYLEKTFQIEPVRPFSTNPESELTKSINYYFSDLGMRNFVFNGLSHYDPIVSGPMQFQNFIYLLLRENDLVSKVNFWRTKSGAEMDLIANIGTIKIPVEAKFQDLENAKVSASMKSFIDRYSPERMFVVNKKLMDKVRVKETDVFFVPYTFLITGDLMGQIY